MLFNIHTLDNGHQRHALLVGRDVLLGRAEDVTSEELNEFLGSVSERECWTWEYVATVDAGNDRGVVLFLFRRTRP